MTERLDRIRADLRDMQHTLAQNGSLDPGRVLELLEDLRLAVELIADQAADIANNRLPPLERGAPHLQGD